MTAQTSLSLSRRRTELGLLVLVILIVAFAYLLMSLGVNGRIPPNADVFLGVLVGLAVLVHLVNRRLIPNADATLLPIVFLLNGLGYVFIVRIKPHLAGYQAVWTLVGVVGYVIALVGVRRFRDLERYRYLILVAALGLLLLPLVPRIGLSIGGARLWVRIGPITFQPVELAKIGLVIFLASYFTERRELLTLPTQRVGNRLLPSGRILGPILFAWAFVMIVMAAERNIGFALLLFVLFMAMIWLATGHSMYIVSGVLLFAFGTFVSLHSFSQVAPRINDWLDPWHHLAAGGGQIVQAQYGLGTGGLTGSGLGLGRPYLVPISYSDFIFAAIGEELGWLGTVFVLVAFVLIVATGLRIAIASTAEFTKLLVAGFTLTIGLQAIFIMAGVIRLLPLTGLTLPFVAYGGSSLFANYVLLALLMRASHESCSGGPG